MDIYPLMSFSCARRDSFYCFSYNKTVLACWFPTSIFTHIYHLKFLEPLNQRLPITKELVKRRIWVGTLPYWVTENTNLSLYESRHICRLPGITERYFSACNPQQIWLFILPKKWRETYLVLCYHCFWNNTLSVSEDPCKLIGIFKIEVYEGLFVCLFLSDLSTSLSIYFSHYLQN